MIIPSIEDLKLHISDPRTKNSIDEVLSSFYSGNTRSAVVMLYATVVSDLYYKLVDLVDIYNDQGAKLILDFVKDEWQNHKTSPAWESEMPKKCHDANKILDNASYAHFVNLQTERNLCAHPVIDGSLNLYRPTHSKVQALILDMLSGVLCKPSFLSKDLFNSFTDDIEKSSALFPNAKGLCDYIKAKYLEKIDNAAEEYAIFKKLWKLVFKLNDPRSNNNRSASYAVLKILFERNREYILNAIKSEKVYYGSNVKLDDNDCLETFIRFVNINKPVLSQMPEDFNLSFNQKINESTDLRAMAFCLHDNYHEHLNSIANPISYKTAVYIQKFTKSIINNTESIDFGIRMYSMSNSYDAADLYFDNLVEPNLRVMSANQLENLIRVSNSNSQIYDRRLESVARGKIVACMNKYNTAFDYTPYPNF